MSVFHFLISFFLSLFPKTAAYARTSSVTQTSPNTETATRTSRRAVPASRRDRIVVNTNGHWLKSALRS